MALSLCVQTETPSCMNADMLEAIFLWELFFPFLACFLMKMLLQNEMIVFFCNFSFLGGGGGGGLNKCLSNGIGSCKSMRAWYVL